MKGSKHSAETLNKMSIIKLGKKSPMKGRHWKLKSRKKMSISSKKRFSNKENHPRWKGGITTYERKLWLNLQRRTRKLNADGTHTFEEWENMKAQYNWTCPCCGKREPEIKLTEDHIISLSKGGSDNIENIQPLCRSCNSKKHTETIKY